ncbi:magnesium transporter [Sutterella sp.]|uniref:magnesium transporter n=1 Tax=Sutterella sp. TaxID=1981025 RepID=UPI0025E13834|nr:magnesium transporter [uncultured Sutterella sp.]
MSREDEALKPGDEEENAPTLDSDEASRALARVQQILDEDEDRARELAKERGDQHDDARPITPEAAQELRDVLEPLHPADIAWVLEALPLDDRLAVWNQVKSESDGDILLEVNEGVRETLIDAMDRDELVDAVETLDTDQIADLVDDLPPDVMAEVQEGLSHEERVQLRAAMSYPEESVGARMDFEMISIREEVTVDMVLRYLRRFKTLPDHMDQIFVVDRMGILKGTLPLVEMLTNDPTKQVRRIMNTEAFTLNPLDSASDAAQAFERYDLVSAAVVDEAGRLVGRLTVNEVVDVIREESEEDAFGAVGLDDEQDMYGGVWDSAKSRWLWLGVNLCTAFFASRVISAFDGTIERVVALAALMPIVAGMAGNSGNQTLTLLVRSLAMGQVTMANTVDIWKKEIGVALINGLIWGVIAGACAWGLYWNMPEGRLLGLVMALAMFLNILQGAVVGLAVPFILKKFGRDPAMGGSVLLTFTTDSGGFLIFLGLATAFFR